MSQLLDRLCYSSRVLDRPCYRSQVSNRLCYSSQISVTAPCYSSILFRKQQKNPSSRREGMSTRRREEKRVGECASTWGRERDPQPFGSSFHRFFPPLGVPYVNWASQECCLFYLRSSLGSSDLPLFYFHGLFPSLSFRHRHSGLLFLF